MAKPEKKKPDSSSDKKKTAEAEGLPVKYIVWFLVAIALLFITPIVYKEVKTWSFSFPNWGVATTETGSKKNSSSGNPNNEEKKVKVSTSGWSEPLEVSYGETFNVVAVGKYAVRVNRDYGGGEVFERNPNNEELFLLNPSTFKKQKDGNGEWITTKGGNIGDPIHQLEFLSLDVEKIVTVVLKKE